MESFHVVEGCNLGEGGADGVEKGCDLSGFFAETHDEHDLPVLRCPHEHVAEEAVIFPDIIEGETAVDTILLDKQTDSV